MMIVQLIFIISIFLTTVNSNLIIDNNGSFNLSENEILNIEGDLFIGSNSSLIANTNTNINISNNWKNLGSFNPSTSIVKFINTNESHIEGNNTFYSFVAIKDLLFQSQSTQKFLQSVTLKGDATSSTVHSDVIGEYAILDLSNHPTIIAENLEIQDMKNIGIINALMPNNSVNLGNSILWFDEHIDVNCTTKDDNITSFNSLQCNDSNQSDIKYVSADTSATKSEIIISSSIIVNVVKTITQSETTLIYDDSATQCNINAIIKLIDDGTTATGFINGTNCDTYEDPTLKNFDVIKSDVKVFVTPTNSIQKAQHGDASSVLIIDINLTNPIVIGDK